MTCPKCGEVLADNATTCSFCGAAVNPAPKPDLNNPQPAYENPQPGYVPPVEEKPENVVAGTVGALIGALLGGVAIILLGQLGYVASISGVILAICSLKGYELLGGKLSPKGIIISIVLMLIIPAVSYFLNIAISVVREYPGTALSDALTFVIELTKADSEMQSAVIKELLMLYGFTALGAVSLVINAFKKKS